MAIRLTYKVHFATVQKSIAYFEIYKHVEDMNVTNSILNSD